MQGDRTVIVRAFARAAKLRADELTAAGTVTTLTGVLEQVILGNFTSEITNGKVLVSTSVNGQTVGFAMPGGLSPLEVMALAEEALAWCQQFTDPNSPTFTSRRITRLQADFSGAWSNL